MTAIYSDDDASPAALAGRRVAVLGFGNQGSAQAHNLRDSGVDSLVVGNRHDDYRQGAEAAGFRVVDIAQAAREGQVVLLLIPDEVQPTVFDAEISPQLAPGDTLVVASGYNVAFGLLAVPEGVDVAMVAPRMIGAAVRTRYLEGRPYPCFVSVERDATGQALARALAVARAIGATRGGAISSSAREEAALDLLSEQAVWPAIIEVLEAAYEVAHAEGFSDEAILSELYLSGEPAEIMAQVAELGLFGQFRLHSQTSQYGQLRALDRADLSGLRARFTRVLRDDILSGVFAREWSGKDGARAIASLLARATARPLAVADAAVRAAAGRPASEPPRS